MTKILNEIRQRGSFYSLKDEGGDVFKVSVPAGESFRTCRLTILDTHLGGSAKLTSSPEVGVTGRAEVSVAWQCKGNADVRFQVEAFSQPVDWANGADSVTCQTTGFLPTRHGWPFDNRFEKVPPFKLIGELKYGDASKGLCGGMVYAALDYFMAGMELPVVPDAELSKYKSPLHGPIFDYFGRRLFHSFDIPRGVMNYVELMHPGFPDCQVGRMYPALPPQNRAWRTIRQEWPVIKSRLDAGQPCPLGLIRVKSKDLKKLGENHQVLAYGYDLQDDLLTLSIYDPNYHANDHVTLTVNIADPEQKLKISYWDKRPVYCLFQTHYSFSMPPSMERMPGRILLFEDENFCGKSIDVISEHPDLSLHKLGNFGNKTSSCVILSGRWSFFGKPGFESPLLQNGLPIVLGPGTYRRISDSGMLDNEIVSLKSQSTRIPRPR